MSIETEFVGGLIVKPPREGVPGFVKAKLSFKREEMIAWLQSREGDWINADVKESKGGKWYAAVDNWKPTESRGGGGQSAPKRDDEPFHEDKIPF